MYIKPQTQCTRTLTRCGNPTGNLQYYCQISKTHRNPYPSCLVPNAVYMCVSARKRISVHGRDNKKEEEATQHSPSRSNSNRSNPTIVQQNPFTTQQRAPCLKSPSRRDINNHSHIQTKKLQ